MADDTSQRSQRRRRRAGASLRWSDADIEQAAEVGPEDADAAEIWWNKHAPRQARDLLSAEEMEADNDAES